MVGGGGGFEVLGEGKSPPPPKLLIKHCLSTPMDMPLPPVLTSPVLIDPGNVLADRKGRCLSSGVFAAGKALAQAITLHNLRSSILVLILGNILADRKGSGHGEGYRSGCKTWVGPVGLGGESESPQPLPLFRSVRCGKCRPANLSASNAWKWPRRWLKKGKMLGNSSS